MQVSILGWYYNWVHTVCQFFALMIHHQPKEQVGWTKALVFAVPGANFCLLLRVFRLRIISCSNLLWVTTPALFFRVALVTHCCGCDYASVCALALACAWASTCGWASDHHCVLTTTTTCACACGSNYGCARA
jgi:hypothetical protein